jgi:hypothetical protein
MAVEDDLRHLSQMDSIFLGWFASSVGPGSSTVVSWYKGRVQQANDGNWLFRSISSDGSVVGFQLGMQSASWASVETPATGIAVTIPIYQMIMLPNQQVPSQLNVGSVVLRQQLPQELTN